MIAGAREARSSWLRRLVDRAAARELAAFVVPGPEVARARGLDIEAAGLRLVSAPRHASVLVIVGALPEGLREAAAVVYAQMARPRAVLAAGAGDVSPLPADIRVATDQESLETGVAGLRRSFTENAWRADAETFEAGVLTPQKDEDGEEEQDEGSEGDDHGSMEHESGEEQEEGSEGEEEQGGESDEGGGEGEREFPEPVPGEDFMSMVEMTKDMPASGDGLKMEWIEVPYGPFFPGLPGGLSLTLTLDGDTVAAAEAESGIAGRASIEGYTGAVEEFDERLARLDPLSPVAYRVLALRAVEAAAGVEIDERTALARVGAMERERAAGHLGWLGSFGYLIGAGWLSRRAGELQLALLRADAGEVERLRLVIGGFIQRVARTPLLESRLGGIGHLSTAGAAAATGPVARAGGIETDARMEEEVYRDLGFAPVVREGNDALARLWARLDEIERSLDLVRKAGSVNATDRPKYTVNSGAGTATVETPRGAATLSVTLEGGAVSAVELDAPSARHGELIKAVTEGREVGDALVGVASLDLSPWEVAR